MAFDRNAEADQAYGHKPVLLDECLEALAIRPDGVYLDGTLGRAGHSLEILRRLTAGGRLIGLDRDGTALEAARVRLAEYADRVTLVHSNFSRLAEVLDDLHIDAVDGMLFDLGVSSPQLDDAERGFSSAGHADENDVGGFLLRHCVSFTHAPHMPPEPRVRIGGQRALASLAARAE